MGNQMTQAFEATQTGGTQSQRKAATPQGGRRAVASPPTPRSASDILAAARTRAEARRQRARQTADASSVQLIVALLETRNFLQTDYEELNRNRALYPDAIRQLAEIERELGQVKADLDFYLNPAREEGEDEASFVGRKHQMLLSVEEAQRLVAIRDAARGWSDAIKAIENPDARTLTAFLEDAEGNIGPFVAEVAKGSSNHVTTWKGKCLGSAVPEDEVVFEVVKTFGEKVKTFVNRKEKEDDDVVQLLVHANYFISDDEVEAVRKGSQSANLTRFLGNREGTYSVMGYRFGEVLVLERRADGKVYPFKASGAKIGRMAFLYRDRNANGALTPVDRNRLRPLEYEVTKEGTIDVSKVWHNDLREALEFQLRREAENAERREASREVRNVSGLQDPVTSYDLSVGKVGTCLMDYGLRRGDRFERIPPYRLASDGTHVWVSERAPGALEKADPGKTWLLRQVKQGEPNLLDPNNPLPIARLRKSHEWNEASRANGHTEARWQTELKTKELGATAVTRTNLDGLTSVENGVDGVYTFTDGVRRKGTTPKPYFVPGGFAVERKGSTLRRVWATPNVQRELERLGEEFVEVTNLPDPWLYLLQSLYLGVTGLRKEKDGWKKAPAHLQREVKAKDSNNGNEQEETEE